MLGVCCVWGPEGRNHLLDLGEGRRVVLNMTLKK